MRIPKIFLLLLLVFVALPFITSSMAVSAQNVETAKDTLYQQFNTNRRANPKEAYRIAQEYLQKYGGDKDTNTGTIKEWLMAYEAVVGRVGDDAAKPQTSMPTVPTVTNASAGVYTPFSEINGTTWQVKGEENGKKWATIMSFSAGGRLQYENYAVSGTSTLLKGTWRQLDSDIFGTLLGPDGNTVGTITGQALNGVLEGTIKWSDDTEWRFSLESDSVPNLRKLAESKRWAQIESTQDAQEIRDYLFAFPKSPHASAAQKKLTDLGSNPPPSPQSAQIAAPGTADRQAESKAWDAVAKSLSAADIQVYLSYFPNGINSSKAREKMRSMDDSEWQIIEKATAEEGYRGYVEKYPYGKYANAVKERIASIKESETEWTRISISNKIEDFRTFLGKYPYGKNADLARERVNPPAVGTMKTNSLGMRFMYIPAGTFMMGNGKRDAKPVHQVTISVGFWMGKYEVTQGQWQSVIGNNPSGFSGCGDDCPVDMVFWDGATTFIEKLNEKNDGFIYSLPTEAEWEYAARAGTIGDSRAGTIGDYRSDNHDYNAVYKINDMPTYPVGQKSPNAFGLHGMLGNVTEWCKDYYQDNYAALPTDGTANLTLGERKYRVFRGIGYAYRGYGSRSVIRHKDSINLRDFAAVGFRVVARTR